MSWKRQLFLVHRWAGIVLCLFFALWFVSGIVMMYVPFPELTRAERLRGSRALDFSAARLSPGEAIAKLGPDDFLTRGTTRGIEEVPRLSGSLGTPRSVRLTMILERPAYVVQPENGAQPRVVFADDGSVLREVTPQMGRAAVAAFVARSGWAVDPRAIAFEGSQIRDQWSISSALHAHRPLLLYSLNDSADTRVYVSSRTGEVVRDTHLTERVLNYFGAVTHWIYPTVLRQFVDLWVWIVDILSSVGVVLAITGMWIGWLRWNRRARPGKPQVPYTGLMRWHYFSGIIFGVVTITWVFSGLMSMNPLSLNPPRSPDAAQVRVYAGEDVSLDAVELPAAGFGAGAIDADIVRYAGQPFYRVTRADMTTRLVGGNPQAVIVPSAEAMIARAPALLPSAKMIEALVRRPAHLVPSRPDHRPDHQSFDAHESRLSLALQRASLLRHLVAVAAAAVVGHRGDRVLARRHRVVDGWRRHRLASPALPAAAACSVRGSARSLTASWRATRVNVSDNDGVTDPTVAGTAKCLAPLCILGASC